MSCIWQIQYILNTLQIILIHTKPLVNIFLYRKNKRKQKGYTPIYPFQHTKSNIYPIIINTKYAISK